jgi:hypothetical protein
MIYDCMLFNDELDILELRLEYMSEHVDYFVIGESRLTFSNNQKPLVFKQNARRFSKYENKIIYLEIPASPQPDSWTTEHYQRNYLKNALSNCRDNDLVIIADVDEFLNLEYILEKSVSQPILIEMPVYYYFLNLKTSTTWLKTLISPYQYLKHYDIGDREKYFNLNPQILRQENVKPGWHFSYLFGWDLDLYISKLKSFSHQEFNSPHYLNRNRINTCLSLGIDILERYSVYQQVDIENEVTPALFKAIYRTLFFDKYVYHKPSFAFYINFYHLKYYLKFVVKLKLRVWFDKIIKRSKW